MIARYSRPKLLASLLFGVCLSLFLPQAMQSAEAALNPAQAVQRTDEVRWKLPLGRPLNVIGPYRAPPSPYESGHRGIDLLAVRGDAVMAPATGAVSFVGIVVDRPVISVRVDDDTVVSFEPVVSALSVGAEVPRGGLLGTVSAGGDCSDACLHLGVRVNDRYVNPMRFFRGRPMLLPLRAMGTKSAEGGTSGP